MARQISHLHLGVLETLWRADSSELIKQYARAMTRVENLKRIATGDLQFPFDLLVELMADVRLLGFSEDTRRKAEKLQLMVSDWSYFAFQFEEGKQFRCSAETMGFVCKLLGVVISRGENDDNSDETMALFVGNSRMTPEETVAKLEESLDRVRQVVPHERISESKNKLSGAEREYRRRFLEARKFQSKNWRDLDGVDSNNFEGFRQFLKTEAAEGMFLGDVTSEHRAELKKRLKTARGLSSKQLNALKKTYARRS
jgi:hypothetical protein